MKFKPKGIIPPIVTPFDENGNVNEKVLRELINFLIDGGVHGLFPMGTTGEYYALNNYEYEKMLDITVSEVNGRVPIYAGCNSITTKDVLKLVKIAEKVKVDAISVLTPMFISQTQTELFDFFKTISENSQIPIVMYNNKPKTNVTIEPETVARLSEFENIVGIKDSTGDFTNTEEYLRLTRGNENFHVLLGRDTLIYAGLCYGASGAVASCANVAPRITADIYDNFVSGNLEAALEAQFKLAPLRIISNIGTFPAVIKEGINMLGIPVGNCLSPINELSSSEKLKVRKVLIDMELLKN